LTDLLEWLIECRSTIIFAGLLYKGYYKDRDEEVFRSKYVGKSTQVSIASGTPLSRSLQALNYSKAL
jgi:hypothetical protein